MIDAAAEKTIRDWTPPENITISVLNADHPEQKHFKAFAGEWAGLSSAVTWTDDDQEADLPGFRLKDNITYSALPLERELPPFLSGLENLDRPPLSPDIRKMLDRIQLPCELTLYIALQCPHCPGMVDALIPLAAYSDKIRLHIIDGSMFREQASIDKVMSAPCLILDKGFRWTGSVPETEVLSMIINRDPALLSTTTLKNILEEGDADWITEEMIRAGTIFDGFLGLILHETWSVRLGAMVVVESLAERAPDLGLKLAPMLIGRFEEQEIPVQGDILYVLGEIGDLETGAWIRACKNRIAHADLKDAADDAIDAVDSRLGSGQR
ncbi:MAG: thioredoxin family protein [Desulfobacterales bacterium]|nr:thioredoxin family protein [Desulfobacterales bacterium]